MNERLLAFARNIAAILLIGGLALLIIYRAETMKPVETYQYMVLVFSGVIMLLWSMYLAFCNAAVLRQDYLKYLKKCLEKEEIEHNLDEKKINSTSRLTFILARKSGRHALIYYVSFLAISLIGFSFIVLYILGILSVLNQQAKVFGFIFSC
ncbi:hypothetical protein ABE427_13085 [Acinetobacter higginsii]|uniref:hypothetical protein n=1 Tax=Acinetobacter higginsii TaxID=70347 RepID=UPI00320AAEB0